MRIWVVEKQTFVFGDDVDPGSLSAWIIDRLYHFKRDADRYANRLNDNPGNNRRRVFCRNLIEGK